jgi:hypothetical protein
MLRLAPFPLLLRRARGEFGLSGFLPLSEGRVLE